MHSDFVCVCVCVCVCVRVCLQAFGVVVKLSDGILGITLLAWGNSIGGTYTYVHINFMCKLLLCGRYNSPVFIVL